MDTCVFAFGLNESYIYNAPSKWKWSRTNLPAGVAPLTFQFKDITWVAFGEKADSYFVSYVNKEDKNLMSYGPGVPAAFKAWLTDPDTKKIRRNKHTRVTFGPNEGFVAWDSTSIRWHNIPPALEELFQDWLSPAGWKFGPPRIICLGQEGAYLAISEHGWWAYKNLPGEMKNELNESGKDLGTIKAATLSMFGPHYVAIFEEGFYCYDVPNPTDEENEEAICGVLDSFHSPETAAAFVASRAEARKKRHAEEAKKRHDKEDEIRKERMIKTVFQIWTKQCDEYFSSTEPRTVFKHPPPVMNKCREAGCLSHKQAEGSIGACKHDMGKLLRASDQYSLAWLRKERLKWHPDKFGQRCDSIFRQELTKKSTQMYSIYEELIAEEAEKQENGGQGGGK